MRRALSLLLCRSRCTIFGPAADERQAIIGPKEISVSRELFSFWRVRRGLVPFSVDKNSWAQPLGGCGVSAFARKWTAMRVEALKEPAISQVGCSDLICGAFLSVAWFGEPKLLNLFEIANCIVDLGDFFRIEFEENIA